MKDVVVDSGLAPRSITLESGHTSQVVMVNFSPHGGRVVTASEDHTAIVWDVATGRKLARLCGHQRHVTFACFSPDGSRVASGACDERVILWDSQTGDMLHCLQVHDGDIWSPRGGANGEGTRQKVSPEGRSAWHTPSRLGFSKFERFYRSPFVHFSPDSARLVTVCLGVAKMWHAPTGNQLFELLGHNGWIRSARFSPDGHSVVTASLDCTAAVWDAYSGQKQLTLSGHKGSVTCARFSPDGQFILTVSNDGSAILWDRQSGRAIWRLRKPRGAPHWARISQDGRKFVFDGGSGEQVDVWDLQSGSKIATLEGHKVLVNSVDFHPHGHQIVIGYGDGRAIVWDCYLGRAERVLFGHTKAINFVRFSPDGTYIVTASMDSTTIIWEAASGRIVSLLPGWCFPVRTVCLRLNGRRILCSGQPIARVCPSRPPDLHFVTGAAFRERIAEAIVWDIPSGKRPEVFRGWISSESLSPDGRRVVTTVDTHSTVVWDAESAEKRCALKHRSGHTDCAEFSPNGRMIVTYSEIDKNAIVWDADTAKKLSTIRHGLLSIKFLYFSPDSQLLVTPSQNGGALVWDARSGKKRVALRGEDLSLVAGCFSPDSRSIVAASNSTASVVVFDLTASAADAVQREAPAWLNAKQIGAVPAARVLQTWKVNDELGSARFSPNGQRVLAVCGRKQCLVWDAVSGERINALTGQDDQFCDAVFSVDGSKVLGISLGAPREIATLWDVESGQQIATLSGHESWLNWAQFTPDGRYIVTASDDGSIRFWDATSGKEIIQLWDLPGPYWIAATADGYFDGSVEVFGMVRHRDSTGACIEPDLSLKYYRPNLLHQVLSARDV